MADANAGSSSSLSSPSEPLPRSGVVTSSSTHSPSRPRQSTGPLTPASCASGPGSCSSPSPAQAAKRELTQTPPRLVAQTAKQKVLSMATPLRYWLMHLASTAGCERWLRLPRGRWGHLGRRRLAARRLCSRRVVIFDESVVVKIGRRCEPAPVSVVAPPPVSAKPTKPRRGPHRLRPDATGCSSEKPGRATGPCGMQLSSGFRT